MSELAEFYADRLDEAERRALLFLADPTGTRDSTRALQLVVDAGDYAEWFGPAWVLRQVEAGRKILALHKPDRNPADQWYGNDVRCEECGGITGSPAIGERGFNRSWPCQTLRAAVSVFSGHPGYKPEWSPEGVGQRG